MSETEHKEIVGTCSEISEKNGWTIFHINIGRQYPVKLSTKKDDVVAKARAVGTQNATWKFGETESETINEHTGKPYVNRYLNDVEVGASVQNPAAGAAPQARASTDAAHPPLLSGDKDRSITRMAVLKAAAETFAGTGDVEGVIAAAARFETWVMRDIDPVPFDQQPRNSPQAASGATQSADEPPHDVQADQYASVAPVDSGGPGDSIPF